VKGVCGGRPTILGTRIAVSNIAYRHRRGESVDEMLEAWPHLTPAQVYDALAFYYDHKAEIDEEVERSLDEEYWKSKYAPGKGLSGNSAS
jgi:uncharacterized protein (DUF433 family)